MVPLVDEIYLVCGELIMILHWKKYSAKSPISAANLIILFTNVRWMMAVWKIVCNQIFPIMPIWCEAVANKRWMCVGGTIFSLIAVTIFIPWKQNWVYAMQSIRIK